MKIGLQQIRIDGGTQSRVSINETVVAEYADAMVDGAVLPAVVVFHDGADYWLADGFHRYHAHRRIGAVEIDADAHQGTKRDALLYAYGANQTHGLRRTNEDKRKAVDGMLSEVPEWSDSRIAKHVGVSHPTVAARRAILKSFQDAPAARQVERNGKTYTQNVASIGRSPAKRCDEQATTAPPASQPLAHAAKPDPESEDGPSMADLLDDMQKDLVRAETRVAELEKLLTADGKEAAANLARRLEHALRQQEVLQDDASRLQRKADRYERMLGQIGKAVGEPDLDKVVDAVRALARAAKAAQC